MTAPAIVARGLGRQFGPFRALDNVTFEVPSGIIYGLVGPNGAGKTTLVRTLCGLLSATSGEAIVLGKNTRTAAEEIRQTVGYMSQKFSLYADLTAQENLTFFATMHGLSGAARTARIDELVALLGLGPYMKRPAAALSGGWKQRLALATTVLHSPALMFLDEPTAGVDPVARRDLWDLLADMAAAGTTIFVTTQYMDEVERCTAVGYMYLSRLVVSGSPAELKAHPQVSNHGKLRHVEIETDQALRAVRWLREQPFCDGATVFGRTIHARIVSDWTDEDVRSAFETIALTRLTVRTIEPTLEDVFVALTRSSAKGKN